MANQPECESGSSNQTESESCSANESADSSAEPAALADKKVKEVIDEDLMIVEAPPKRPIMLIDLDALPDAPDPEPITKVSHSVTDSMP